MTRGHHSPSKALLVGSILVASWPVFAAEVTPGWPFRVKGQVIEQSVGGPLQVNNGETMKQMMLAGVGISRVGLWHVAAEIKSGTLKPLLEKYNPGDIEMVHAVYVGGGRVPNRVRAFIDHLVRSLGQSPLAR